MSKPLFHLCILITSALLLSCSHEERYIHVIGEGHVSAVSDEIAVYITMNSRNNSIDESFEELDKIQASVYDFLRSADPNFEVLAPPDLSIAIEDNHENTPKYKGEIKFASTLTNSASTISKLKDFYKKNEQEKMVMTVVIQQSQKTRKEQLQTLYSRIFADARQKAEQLAADQHVSLTKLVNVSQYASMAGMSNSGIRKEYLDYPNQYPGFKLIYDLENVIFNESLTVSWVIE